MHLWKEHAVDTDLYSCAKCAFRTDTLLKLEMHQEIHSSDRPYVCDVCNKVIRNHLATKFNLKFVIVNVSRDYTYQLGFLSMKWQWTAYGPTLWSNTIAME